MTIDSRLDHFDLPPTQTEIGDAIGLANVSVSQAIGELERAGSLSRSGASVTLRQPDDLIHAIGVSDHHDHLDTSWFPE